MKKTLLTVSFAFFCLLGFTSKAEAISGDCSWHYGINCNAGADWDGSVICNDGWRDSKDSYYDAELCENSSNLSLLGDPFTLYAFSSVIYYGEFIKECYDPLEKKSQYFNSLTIGKNVNCEGNLEYFNSVKEIPDQLREYCNSIYVINKTKIDFMYEQMLIVYSEYPELISIIKEFNSATMDGLDEKKKEADVYIRDIQNYGEKTNDFCKSKLATTTNPTSTLSDRLFSDIYSTHKNYQAISYMKENGIINGYPDGSFQPANPVNRAELLKILIESLAPNFDRSANNSACFSDVKADEWFTAYACYAKAQGWVSGYADGSFKPAQTVSRAEAVKIVLFAYDFATPASVFSTPFTDVKIGDWFAPYLDVASKNAFLDVSSGAYRPNEGMTRADVSQLIYNVLISR